VTRRGGEPTLLARIHGLLGPAEAGGAPVAHLHEDQDPTIAHHEIDLAEAAAVVAPDQAQTLAGEKVGGKALLVPADRAPISGPGRGYA
jgi:hypothetical protein